MQGVLESKILHGNNFYGLPQPFPIKCLEHPSSLVPTRPEWNYISSNDESQVSVSDFTPG
jgi:hypothetical protein